MPAVLAFGLLRLVGQTQDQLALLQDSAGWEYISMTDEGNGFETQHVCFDTKVTGQCRGKLSLGSDGTFVQSVTSSGKSLNRHGTYQFDDSGVTFQDEFGNKDGPYTWDLNPDEKTLVLETDQAGVHIKVNLLLEKEFQRRLSEKQKQKKNP
jgi:hypothetical protein